MQFAILKFQPFIIIYIDVSLGESFLIQISMGFPTRIAMSEYLAKLLKIF